MKTIEVELRGRLTDEQYDALETFLKQQGTLVETQDREMYLLRGYPGYSDDFATRNVDIRLRNTNGKCEIMLKQKIGGADATSDSREEVSFGLTDTTLDNAIRIVKALGVSGARWMHRKKQVYSYDGVEWSLVTAPPSDIRYFEVEIVVTNEADIPAAREKVSAQAASLGLTILDVDGSRALIAELNEKANTVVHL